MIHHGERKMAPSQVPAILADVLVDEVMQIVQRFPRHPGSGVMKCRWDFENFVQMAYKPLSFCNVDDHLVQRGLTPVEPRVQGAKVLALNHVQ
jgi:hypothetical protein